MNALVKLQKKHRRWHATDPQQSKLVPRAQRSLPLFPFPYVTHDLMLIKNAFTRRYSTKHFKTIRYLKSLWKKYKREGQVWIHPKTENLASLGSIWHFRTLKVLGKYGSRPILSFKKPFIRKDFLYNNPKITFFMVSKT